MTTTLPTLPLSAAPKVRHRAAPKGWTFEVWGMDRGYRASVEKLLLLLPEGGEGEVWYTRWRRDADGTYSCREHVVATEAELRPFERELSALAEGNFVAQVTQRAYHGLHV